MLNAEPVMSRVHAFVSLLCYTLCEVICGGQKKYSEVPSSTPHISPSKLVLTGDIWNYIIHTFIVVC